MTHEYENIRRIMYGDTGASFIPVCSICHRFVKADNIIMFNKFSENFNQNKPNATCKKCGRTQMIFEGFI